MIMFHVNLSSTSFIFLTLIDLFTKPQLVNEAKWHVKIGKEKVRGCCYKKGERLKQQQQQSYCTKVKVLTLSLPRSN